MFFSARPTSRPRESASSCSICKPELLKPITFGKADLNAFCSPDSTFFLYTKLENGKKLLMRQPLNGGEAKQIFPDFAQFASLTRRRKNRGGTHHRG